jgi:F-type H+-transporting ATPase subunit b
MFRDPTFWVGVSFLFFMALLIYYKIPGKLGEALDNRAEKIRQELEEARKLREEAQAILAEYQRKQREAEKSAEEIISLAKQEAVFFADETHKALEESLERRTRIAEEKIARAEAQALEEVRVTAVDIAVAAANKLISANMSGDVAANLIDKTIQDLKTRLN